LPGYDPFEVYNQYLKNTAEPELLNKLMLLDLKVFHPDCTLHVMDMATMMNSQECRVPFLDIEMIELSQKIPINLKLHNLTTKYIIRKAFTDYLPKEIIGMPKKGLAMPTSFWLGNELKNFITGVINESEKTNKDMFDFDYVRHIFNEHVEGKRDNTRKITCLVSFFLWQRFYQ
jgi:asparagine synthase (glutamine-hydrolysing)